MGEESIEYSGGLPQTLLVCYNHKVQRISRAEGQQTFQIELHLVGELVGEGVTLASDDGQADGDIVLIVLNIRQVLKDWSCEEDLTNFNVVVN